ncbi:MAG: protein-glutamate O-methyltransferase CheR [Chloroflexota bacterium]
MTGQFVGERELLLSSVLEKLYREGGYDFREYKTGTVNRRLERRLHTLGVRDYAEYLRFLDACPGEYEKLLDTLTIKVSGFLRSPIMFQQVADRVLPAIIRAKRQGGEKEIRFWSAACARGEEPYSIAIMLAEALGEEQHAFHITVHATDICPRALADGEAAVYPAADLQNLAPGLVSRYFERTERGYQVTGSIRRMVRFARFDLTAPEPPPFRDIDCIFCCNVLIYWQRPLQERVLRRLTGTLADPGYLVLGEMESLPAGLQRTMRRADDAATIYRRITDDSPD